MALGHTIKSLLTPSLKDQCNIDGCIDNDYKLLNRYLTGTVVTNKKDICSINRLAGVGQVRLGTTEIETEDGMIELYPTAKVTELGRRVLRIR
jgi:hypothetical protein